MRALEGLCAAKRLVLEAEARGHSAKVREMASVRGWAQRVRLAVPALATVDSRALPRRGLRVPPSSARMSRALCARVVRVLRLTPARSKLGRGRRGSPVALQTADA